MNDSGANAPTKNNTDKDISPGIIDDFFSTTGFGVSILFSCFFGVTETSIFGGG